MVALPQASSTDVILTRHNELRASLQALLADFDGANIEDASVPNVALALPRNYIVVPTYIESLSGLNTGDYIDEHILVDVDRAVSANWYYHGCSIWMRAVTPVAGCYLRMYKVPSGGGAAVLQQEIDLDDATLTTAQQFGFGDATLAAEVALSTGDIWRTVYVEAGAPTYTGLVLKQYFSHPHIGNP